MTIGERIRNRRQELGMTQEELAQKLGYRNRSSIHKIELGWHNLTQTKIAAIAEALETTPSYIMGWDEEEPKPVGYDFLKQFVDIVSNMTEEEREDLKNYMNFILSKR